MNPASARRIAVVNKLINKEGQTIVYRSVSAPVSDYTQPWKTTAGGQTLHTFKVVFVDSKNYRQFLQFLKGTDVPEGGKLGLMGPQTFAPGKLDTIYRGTLGYTIEGVKQVDPGGDVLLYKLELAAGGVTTTDADILAAIAAAGAQ